jgi:hypothetical protein
MVRRQAQQNCDVGFDKLSSRFRDYYASSTSYLPDLKVWRENVKKALGAYTDSERTANKAIELVMKNVENEMQITGETLKSQVIGTLKGLEPFVSKTLQEIKIETAEMPNIHHCFDVIFPKFEIESLIFNTNVNSSDVLTISGLVEAPRNEAIVKGNTGGYGAQPQAYPVIQPKFQHLNEPFGNTQARAFVNPGGPPQTFYGMATLHERSSNTNLHQQQYNQGVFPPNYILQTPDPKARGDQSLHTVSHMEMYQQNISDPKSFAKKHNQEPVFGNQPPVVHYNTITNPTFNHDESHNSQQKIRNFPSFNTATEEPAPRTSKNVIDSTIFNKDDNLLVDMNISDIPELSTHPIHKKALGNNQNQTPITKPVQPLHVNKFDQGISPVPQDNTQPIKRQTAPPVSINTPKQHLLPPTQNDKTYLHNSPSTNDPFAKKNSMTPQTKTLSNRNLVIPNQNISKSKSRDRNSVPINQIGQRPSIQNENSKLGFRPTQKLSHTKFVEILHDLKINRLIILDLSDTGMLIRN